MREAGPVRPALDGLGSGVSVFGVDTRLQFQFPGQARVLSSCAMNAKNTETLDPRQDRSKVEATKKRPSVATCQQEKSGFETRNTGSRKHAVLQPTRSPSCLLQSEGRFQESLHQFMPYICT
jgi:hypothetical protein